MADLLGENLDAFLTDDELGGILDLDDDARAPQFARVRQWKPPRLLKYEYAKEAARGIGRVEAGEHVELIVSGNFIAGDFIEAYLEQNNLIASEIIISTLSMSSENVDSLLNVKRQYLTGLMGLVISDYFFAMERRDGIQDIIEKLAGDDFFLAIAGIHTKITLIRTECSMSLVMGGSANLRSSRNIEQITIDNNADLYTFHRGWLAKILNDYQAQHTMIRRDRLWQALAEAH